MRYALFAHSRRAVLALLRGEITHFHYPVEMGYLIRYESIPHPPKTTIFVKREKGGRYTSEADRMSGEIRKDAQL
jgi:hypothetical protein